MDDWARSGGARSRSPPSSDRWRTMAHPRRVGGDRGPGGAAKAPETSKRIVREMIFVPVPRLLGELGLPLSVRIVWTWQGLVSSMYCRNSHAVRLSGIFDELGDGELGCPVDAHEEVRLALGGVKFGNVDMNEPDRVALEPVPFSACRPQRQAGGRCIRHRRLDRWRDMAHRCRHRCSADRVRCGTVGCRAWRQSSSGSSV